MYLISEREGFLLPEIEFLRIVVNYLRLSKSSSLEKYGKLSTFTVHWIDSYLNSCQLVIFTLAHAFANPSKVTYFDPDMLYTCLLAFG